MQTRAMEGVKFALASEARTPRRGTRKGTHRRRDTLKVAGSPSAFVDALYFAAREGDALLAGQLVRG